VPDAFQEPAPRPGSLWSTPPDGSVVWTPYTCKSFACLNERKHKGVFEDCIDCFDLRGRESARWTLRSSRPDDLDYSVAEVLELKRERNRKRNGNNGDSINGDGINGDGNSNGGGSIRIGLDLGGGTASFAARMLEHNVTIVTTSLDLNGPFNSFIALRGLVPLHLSLAHRLPFFDNTLDLVHSMHVLSNWIPAASLEFLLFDIDRVLRPGGLFWLDRFFCFEHQLNRTFLPLFLNLGYKKLRWGVGPKLDRGPEVHEVYLSALLEKPLSRTWT
jgi:SAM-dependent methyltransferase